MACDVTVETRFLHDSLEDILASAGSLSQTLTTQKFSERYLLMGMRDPATTSGLDWWRSYTDGWDLAQQVSR